jgi:hypothetical protein
MSDVGGQNHTGDTGVLDRFAKLALACVEREFPYQPQHALRNAADLHLPRILHPAFYGCYDWHSAVHGHWLLVHALKRNPSKGNTSRGNPSGGNSTGAPAASIRKVLDSHFSAENLQLEADYLEGHPAFERPYGWAWLLKLATELTGWNDRDAPRWRAHMQPLVDVIEGRYLEWLPKQTYPIRSGVHTNTAFGLGFALDYARSSKRLKLENLIVERSIDYYGKDRNYPAAWEPGGNDFFSPCLVEADLMRRVLPDFGRWFEVFLPEIPSSLLAPATVSDRSDGQLAHLDGLNLSRAWCFCNLASSLSENELLLKAAQRHLDAALPNVTSGSYAGEHWLATFAAYALACAFDGATSTPASRSSAT